jgi:hypothetical protein
MRRIAIIAAALVLGAAALLFHRVGEPGAAQPVWTETAWPFPMDQWGQGKAFVCKAADCGAELKLYIRAKIGFCSSTVGVSDDNELDRLSDFDFMNGATAASGEGHIVNVAWMKGRLRTYAAAGRPRAMSVAYNNDSDAVVATVVAADAKAAGVEPAVIAFLNEERMQRWVKQTLGL